MDLSAGPLIASLVVSSVGMGVFMYGKRQVSTPPYVTGLLLMVGPYFTHGVGSTLGLGALLLGAMLAAQRWGA